ncbi:conserved hypothetical protein, partial [Streptococcus agalactiae H36B]
MGREKYDDMIDDVSSMLERRHG